MKKRRIKIISRDYCPVCGSLGKPLNIELVDQLYKVEGRWTYLRCYNGSCGLIWLENAPHVEDIHLVYSEYYTHNQPEDISKKQKSKIYSYWEKAKFFYWYKKFNYSYISVSIFIKLISFFIKLFPIRKYYVESDILFLNFKKDGVVLDVGCGGGDTLKRLSAIGWKGIGIDTDEQAVERTRRNGNIAYLGDLKSQKFAAGNFDAVILNQVLEHVHNPKEILEECIRIMNPDGQLIITTPNASGLGRTIFRRYWRGYEPPRHLCLFTPNSIKMLMNSIGITEFTLKTYIIPHIPRSSIKLKWNFFEISDKLLTKVLLRFLTWSVVIIQFFCSIFYKYSGDQIVVFVGSSTQRNSLK